MYSWILAASLLPGNGFFMFPIFLGGTLLRKRRYYYEAMLLLVWTIAYNPWLKSIWKIPLPPTVKSNTWAFPSGHMHVAMAFFGYLAWNIKSPVVRGLILFLTIFQGWGLVVNGFHYPIDVMGAIGFGALTIVLWQYAAGKLPRPQLYTILASLALLTLALKNPAHDREDFFAAFFLRTINSFCLFNKGI